jgi:uncharacterized protein YgfB (UPF0149 family)
MDNTKMSGKLAHNMTLTIEDQKWLKLLFDRQDEINLANSIKVMDTVEAMIDKQTEKIDEKFIAINVRLNEIKANLNDKEKRLVYLEKYASWPHTVARHSVAIAVGIMIGWFLHTALAIFVH